MDDKLKKWIGFTSLSVGFFLLTVTFLGAWTSLGDYKSAEPRQWEMFDAELVTKTPDLKSLKDYLSSSIEPTLNDQQKMLRIHELVSRRFINSDDARYNLFSNWLMWSVGMVYQPALYIKDPNILLKKGHSGLCSEQSYLLASLAEFVGMRTRHVGLDGHVVMEAWYDDDWHMFDPDLEVVPMLNGQILSVGQLSRLPQSIRTFYEHVGNEDYLDQIVDIVSSRENNSFQLYWMVDKKLAYRVEAITSFLKWLLPVGFLIFGCWLVFQKKHLARNLCNKTIES